MGRRKLYHTPEERAIANRIKSKKYYERCKNGINRKRRSKYVGTARKQNPSKNMDQQPPDKVIDPVASLMELGERVQKRLEKITHGSPYEFVDALCQQYLHDCDEDRVQTFSTKFKNLQELVYLYQNEILQVEGVGENYQTLDKLIRNIRTVRDWVDEVLIVGMIDIAEVQQLYNASELVYQKSRY